VPLGRVTSGAREGTRRPLEVVNACTNDGVLQTFGRNSEI
jgi:hypothetical protein